MFDAKEIKKSADASVEESKKVKNSKFLDELYNDPKKYSIFKSVINGMMEEAEHRRNEELNYGRYTLPLGFQKPMLLAAQEEKVIAEAILTMARQVHEGKYSMQNSCLIDRIEVDDRQQRDVPMPYIRMTIKCPRSIEPKHGLYLRGIFRKEKILKEIVEAKIEKIVYFTNDMSEIELMKF